MYLDACMQRLSAEANHIKFARKLWPPMAPDNDGPTFLSVLEAIRTTIVSLTWLNLHDYFMHSSVSFSTYCHIWASKLSWCLVIDCLPLGRTWIQVLLRHSEEMRASLVLWWTLSWLGNEDFTLFLGLLVTWEPGKGHVTCSGLRVIAAHTEGTSVLFIKFHIYPSEPQPSQIVHHILNMVSVLSINIPSNTVLLDGM